MDAATIASLIASALILLAMVFVTVNDLRTRRIPNWLNAVLLIAYLPLAVALGMSTTAIMASAAAAVLVFLGGLYFFSQGWIGGGDVKLAAVTVLWLGPGLALPYLLLTAIFGAAFTIALFSGLALMARIGHPVGLESGRIGESGLPYGPGMAVATLLLFQVSPWAAAL